MKTTLLRSSMLVLMIVMPLFLSAQWSMVRFDEYNFFTKVVTTAPASSIYTGIDQMTGGSFILRTNNGGANWDSIPLNGSGATYNLNELFFIDTNNGFAGGEKSAFQTMLKTTDNGSTWSEITPDPSLINPINAISFIDPNTGYATDETNLFKTTDGGNTWTTLVPGFGIKDISFLDADNGFACGEISPNAVVMKTTDGGQTWSNLLTAAIPFFTGSSMHKLDVVNANAMYTSALYSNILFRTIDGGLSWDTLTITQIFGIQDFDFISANEGHVLSTMGEIFGTLDGGQTWTLEYAVATGSYGPSVFLNSISFSGTTGYVCGSNGLIKKYMIPTGLTQPSEKNISFYPNPLSGNQFLQIEGINETYNLKIYNNEGQLVYKGEKINDHQLALKLQSGIYTLEITSSQNTFRDKIVVIN